MKAETPDDLRVLRVFSLATFFFVFLFVEFGVLGLDQMKYDMSLLLFSFFGYIQHQVFLGIDWVFVDPSHYKAPFDIVYLVTLLSLYIYLEASYIDWSLPTKALDNVIYTCIAETYAEP